MAADRSVPAGRTVAVSGVVQRPNVFYIAPNNGGVWKSTDYGRTWTPIFDGQGTGSIGALAVAPSDPKLIYVGSGEGLQRPDLSVGDAMYRSADAGKTWEHLGLREGQQIASVIVDPKDANRLFVAVLGHPYEPNRERGVYRSTDAGKTFEQVLYKDENTGAAQVAFDPENSQVIYADLWAARQAPWEIGGSFNGAGSGLFRWSDGGATWKQLTGGLPTVAQGLGRIGFASAPSNAKRMYAQVDAKPAHGGTYVSDDAGENWRKVNNEPRVWGRGSDFASVQVDPKDPEKIYVASTSTYRSTDGGKTFTAIKGAPGVSRKTGYKWKKRYEVGGPPALVDLSRRPHSHSDAIPESTRERLIDMRQKHPTWGARKIRARLLRLEPNGAWPSASTIHRAIATAGLVRVARKRRTVPYVQPLIEATRPNQVWCMDFKGSFECGNGKSVGVGAFAQLDYFLFVYHSDGAL